MTQIVFIGGGNMASAIIGGLIASGTDAARITVVDPSDDQRAQLQRDFGVAVTPDVQAACAAADTILLAVKPQIIENVAAALQGTDLTGKLLISIAAGVTIATLEALFGPQAIVRTMPNTPALLGLGATGLYANTATSTAQMQTAEQIMGACGICVTVQQEALLDAVTAVSGSGPAYYFLMIEEMIKAGTALGLRPEDAAALTLQTALGAASMAARGDVDAAELRRRVTSPNGTTHAAITSLQADDFGSVISKAMTACRDRAIALGGG